MTQSANAVFLSYASQDGDDAQRIRDALRAAGIEVWFDQSELRGGDAWDAAIRQKIMSCALFVALISENTNARSEGYFRLEWKLAVDRSHLMADDRAFLLPVLLGDTREPSARVPEAFRTRQWLQLRETSDPAVLVERVVQLLEARPRRPVDESPPAEDRQSPVTADKGFWIAVLPFSHRGADPEVETLGDGLAEEIVTGLSRFSYLRVIARSSTARYSDAPSDVRTVGQKLGARYVMQGSVRQAGPRARIAVQLVDTITGANLWAETYERGFSAESTFELLDDVAPKIVATIADMNGVLPHAMSELLRGRDPATLNPYEAVLRSFGYLARLDATEHGLVRDALERAVEESPLDADGWAMLSFVYAEEFKHGFNVRDGSLDRALDTARRAVATAPANALCYHMLAQALFFRRDLVAFRNAAERAIELNPMDACTLAFMGILLGYAGDWERACTLAERAMQLNPHHPGWYRFAAFHAAYSRRDFEGAVEVALKFNMPSYFYTHYALAAAYGQLGQREAARQALDELLAQRPDFADVAREELGRWQGHGDLLELALDGLRKAGLSIPD